MLMNPFLFPKNGFRFDKGIRLDDWMNLRPFEALSTSEKQTVTITNRTSQKVRMETEDDPNFLVGR